MRTYFIVVILFWFCYSLRQNGVI